MRPLSEKALRDTDYAYAVGRIRALELKLLTKSDIDTLLSAKSAEDALRALGDKGWDTENVTPDSFESVLTQESEKTWQIIEETVPEPDQFNLLKYKYDFHNLKVALKSIMLRSDNDDYFINSGTCDPAVLKKTVSQKDFKSVPEHLRDAAEECYTVLLETGDGQLCDIIIDKAALEHTVKSGEKSGGFMKGLARLMCATADIKIALRGCRTSKNLGFFERSLAACDGLDIERMARAAASGENDLLDYLGTTDYSECVGYIEKSALEFEKWCDNIIIEYVRSAKMTALGISPIVAYILAREAEIKAVRIIVSAKHNNVSQDVIKERLRETYV